MPFTPYHLGPASLIGLLFFGIFDLPALLIASVVIDIEPFSALALDMDYPMHGFFHSFLGGAVVAGFVSILMYFSRNDIRTLMRPFKLEQSSSFQKIFWTSLFGVYLHILIDSPLYGDMKPLYPFVSNPFYGLFSSEQTYLFSGMSFLAAMMVYPIMLIKKK